MEPAAKPVHPLEGYKAKQIKVFDNFKQKAIDHCAKSEYTEEEKQSYLDEENLVRVCVAREFKEKNSFNMWLKWVNFRRDYQVENITEESIRKELNSMKTFIHKHDKQLRPCTVHLPRRHNPKDRNLDEMVRCGM